MSHIEYLIPSDNTTVLILHFNFTKKSNLIGITTPATYTKFGERACSHTGPAAWNSMPEHIRAEPDIRVFRKLPKTHLFNLAFNIHWQYGFYSLWLLECTYVQHVRRRTTNALDDDDDDDYDYSV